MTATTTTPLGRAAALGRAELTLLRRNRTALATALLLPLGMLALCRPAIASIGLRQSGLSVGALVMSGGIGFVLLFVVYYNLVTAYVARREELVLKRLRTGEPTDLEILAGTALPAVAVALAQCAVLVASGALLPGLDAPRRPDLVAVGVALGIVLLAVLAAASTVFTPSVEVAQLTTLPMLVVSTAGSGLLIPLASLPHPVGEVCRLLPLTSVLELVRAGWPGGGAGAAPHEVFGAAGTAVAWTALAVFAVRRWFRWEPRR